MKKITEKWIEKAEKDFLVSLKEIKSEDPVYDAICFHCEQCVEKYLKAILQENKIPFEKICDLGSLAKMSQDFLSLSHVLFEKVERLSKFDIEVCYPGMNATEEEAEESFDTCKKIRIRARKYFGLEGEDV